MTTIQTAGTLLASDIGNRILSYLLLPFGEPGNTSAGTVTASAGTITIPEDPATLVANDEHEYKAPLGRFVSVTEEPTGIKASVKVAATRAGDDLLTLAAEGLKTGISVEIAEPVIRAGKLLAGKLTGAGFVVRPAFPSAQLTASDMGDLAQELAELAEKAAAAATEDPEEDPADPEPAPAEQEESVLTEEEKAAAIQAAEAAKLSASAAPPAPKNLLAHLADLAGKTRAATTTVREGGVSVADLTAALFNMDAVTNPDLKAAAFDVITQSDMYDPTSTPQYVDELWKGRHRPQIYVPLVNSQTLTSMVVEGWKIVKKPVWGDWDPAFAGTPPNEQMTDIPTNEVTFDKDSWTAKRLARGNRFDRIHVDFPNAAAMAVFLREEAQSLSDLLDEKVKDFILATAKSVTASGADAADPWSKLTFGIANVLEYSSPTFATIGNDLWRQMQNTSEIDRRAWIESRLGLEDGTLQGFKLQPARLSDTEMSGKIVVGAKPAIDLHTPPGAPIRVDAQELQKGAIDKAAFAYYLLKADPEATDKGGVVSVG
jgi:hypothetical protein